MAVKISKLAENFDLTQALDAFLSKANALDVEVTRVLGSYSSRYKFSAIFETDKPKNGTLKSEIVGFGGDIDRVLLQAEDWLNRNSQKTVLSLVQLHCFSYKIIVFWRE